MANGNFAGGDGSETNPYLIEDAWDLSAVRNNLSAHYRLISDIDLDITPFNEGEGWNPIMHFSGDFDGHGFKIRNLFIKREGYGSLFSVSNGGVIRNTSVLNIDITILGGKASHHSGGLASHTSGGTSSKIVNCFTEGKIYSDAGNTGGIIGDLQSGSLVTNCYSNVKLNGSSIKGGLAGYCRGSISNSYSIGEVEQSGSFAGGLVGRVLSDGIVTNSFWNIETSKTTTSAGGVGLTTQEMKTAQTFIDAGWDEEINEDGENVWILLDGYYPSFDSPFINKILILSRNNYQYHDGNEWKSLGSSPTEQDYIDFGMDLSFVETITELQWAELENPVVSFYTDYPDKEEIVVTVETEPFTLYDVMGDSMDILYYTDDENVVDPELEIIANYSPLDEIEGDFDVVTWTDSEQEEVNDKVNSTIISDDIEGGSLYSTTVDLTVGSGVEKISESWD